VRKLVDVGLWLEVEGGYQIYNYGKVYKTDVSAEELSTKRAEAGRLGGLAKASKTVANPPSKPASKRPGKTEPDELAKPSNESGKNLAHVHATRASRAGQDPTPTPTDLTATTSQRPDTSEPLANPSEVVVAKQSEPLAERARKVLENPYDGAFLLPSRWPEVIAAGVALSPGIKSLKLRDNVSGDPDLKAILELYRDGYSVADVEEIGRRARASEWVKGRQKVGPAFFSAAVVRRLMADEEQAAEGEYGPAEEWAT
jgi:hypothetical protein